MGHGEVTHSRYSHAAQDVYFDQGEDSSAGGRKSNHAVLILRTVGSHDILGLQGRGQKIQTGAEGDNYLVEEKSHVGEGLDVPLDPDQKSSLGRDHLHVAVEGHPNSTRHAAVCDEHRDHPHEMVALIGAGDLDQQRMRDDQMHDKGNGAPDEEGQHHLQRRPERMSVGDQAVAIEKVYQKVDPAQRKLDALEGRLFQVNIQAFHLCSGSTRRGAVLCCCAFGLLASQSHQEAGQQRKLPRQSKQRVIM